jgi:endoglucanase
MVRSLGFSALLWAVGCGGYGELHRAEPPAPPPPPLTAPNQASTLGVPAAMLRVSGDQIVDAEGHPVTLRGIAFGNRVRDNVADPRTDHDERDYGRLRTLGMNTARFSMNALSFEDPSRPGEYRESGWAWLDDNVKWARSQGVFLVLSLNVPPGGEPSQGRGWELWESPEVQQRFVALWEAIAHRYRDEPTIAGYDLLNEPMVSSSVEQWRTLANRTISAIRVVDPHHMVFVERVSAVRDDWGENDQRNFVLVDDPNVVYELHFYRPFHFTHQSAPWVDFAARESRYPNPEGVGVEWYDLELKRVDSDGPRVPRGRSDWRLYRGETVVVSDPSWVVGRPVLSCSRNAGRVWFDDLVLEQLDEKGVVKRTLFTNDMSTRRGWSYWSEDGSGLPTEESDGHYRAGSVAISATSGEANLSGEPLQIRLEPGGIYRLSGWMKGQGVSPEAVCQLRFDLYASRVPVLPVDRSYLARELEAYLAFGRAHEVPLYVGEFGAIRDAFELDRGGLRWVSDMLDLFAEHKLHFTYDDYHDAYMGLFYGEGSLPDPANANQPLLELFQKKLGGSSEKAELVVP